MKWFNPVSFHRLPFHDSQTLKQWLLILQIDVDTPINTLRAKDYRVCSAHFDPEDLTQERRLSGETQRMRLKKNAIPKATQPVDHKEVISYSSLGYIRFCFMSIEFS